MNKTQLYLFAWKDHRLPITEARSLELEIRNTNDAGMVSVFRTKISELQWLRLSSVFPPVEEMTGGVYCKMDSE